MPIFCFGHHLSYKFLNVEKIMQLKCDLIFKNTRTKFTVKWNKFLLHTKSNSRVSHIKKISSPQNDTDSSVAVIMLQSPLHDIWHKNLLLTSLLTQYIAFCTYSVFFVLSLYIRVWDC
jgi:hypothetical protein